MSSDMNKEFVDLHYNKQIMNIPTAKDFLEFRTPTGITNDYPDYWEAMIEFAKLHVQKALEEASKKSRSQLDEHDLSCSVDKSSILTAYPLTNIK